MREDLDSYTKSKYGVEPEILPFSKEDYEIYRHPDTGKWFAVFVVKERSVLGLSGDGKAEIVCVKARDPLLADYLPAQSGYLRGYPSRSWNWISIVLDGTVPFEDVCRRLDESFIATKTKAKNQKIPLPKREIVQAEAETTETTGRNEHDL